LQKLPILISYLGGCGGDLVTSSFNGIDLRFETAVNVHADCTIKRQEYTSVLDALADLENKPYRYVSTHQFDLFLNSRVNLVSAEITDDQVKNLCVLRQMYLQDLKIAVDESSHWYCVVKNLCLSHKYEKAAAYWFEQSRRLWWTRMEHRLANRSQIYRSLDFNQLFEEKFTEALKKSGLEFDSNILKTNHLRWLEKNAPQRWNMDSTVESMAKKLMTMDWTKTSGFIEYHA